MTDSFLQSSDYVARKSLVHKTLDLSRTITADLLPTQDGVVNLGSDAKAFKSVITRSITTETISSTGNMVQSLNPIQMKGADLTYATISSKGNTLSLTGGINGTETLISSTKGTNAGYLKIYVGGTPYLIPLYNLPA